jgi:hypothetical protein
MVRYGLRPREEPNKIPIEDDAVLVRQALHMSTSTSWRDVSSSWPFGSRQKGMNIASWCLLEGCGWNQDLWNISASAEMLLSTQFLPDATCPSRYCVSVGRRPPRDYVDAVVLHVFRCSRSRNIYRRAVAEKRIDRFKASKKAVPSGRGQPNDMVMP